MEEFLEWAGNNPQAVQALSALVIAVLTVFLLIATWSYARVTKKTQELMEAEVRARLRPHVNLLSGLKQSSGLKTWYLGKPGTPELICHGNFTVRVDHAPLCFVGGQLFTWCEHGAARGRR